MRFLFFDVEAGKENTLNRSQNVEVIGVYAVAKTPRSRTVNASAV